MGVKSLYNVCTTVPQPARLLVEIQYVRYLYINRHQPSQPEEGATEAKGKRRATHGSNRPGPSHHGTIALSTTGGSPSPGLHPSIRAPVEAGDEPKKKRCVLMSASSCRLPEHPRSLTTPFNAIFFNEKGLSSTSDVADDISGPERPRRGSSRRCSCSPLGCCMDCHCSKFGRLPLLEVRRDGLPARRPLFRRRLPRRAATPPQQGPYRVPRRGLLVLPLLPHGRHLRRRVPRRAAGRLPPRSTSGSTTRSRPGTTSRTWSTSGSMTRSRPGTMSRTSWTRYSTCA